MTALREAAQQALQALEWIAAQKTGGMIQRKSTEPQDALRAALAQQAEPVQDQRCRAEPRSDGDFVCDCKIGECPGRSAALAQQAEPVAWEGWWLHHGQHNYRAKPLSPERVKELMKLAFEVGREATLSHQAEPVQDSGFWGRVAARQASRIKQLETAAQQALEALTEGEISAMAQKTWKPSVYYDAFSLLGTDNLVALVRAIEKASWEKNNG